MYFYGYRQHQPHAFVNKLNYQRNNSISNKLFLDKVSHMTGPEMRSL